MRVLEAPEAGGAGLQTAPEIDPLGFKFPELNRSPGAMAKRKNKLALIRRAIEIQGYLPVPGPRGTTLRVRAIRSVNGKWVTDHLTSDLRGYIKIKRASQDYLVQVAEGILAREDEILAERARCHRVAMGRD